MYRKPLTIDATLATLDWLKETDMATRLETAIARVIAEGKVRTYDMGGKDSTLDVAKAIADYASS
jgi:isocitrate/isopropylmalate dehydrogenase